MIVLVQRQQMAAVAAAVSVIGNCKQKQQHQLSVCVCVCETIRKSVRIRRHKRHFTIAFRRLSVHLCICVYVSVLRQAGSQLVVDKSTKADNSPHRRRPCLSTTNTVNCQTWPHAITIQNALTLTYNCGC